MAGGSREGSEGCGGGVVEKWAHCLRLAEYGFHDDGVERLCRKGINCIVFLMVVKVLLC